MSDVYVIDTGSTYFTSSKEHDDQQAAEDWRDNMIDHGIVGTLMKRDAFLLTVKGQRFLLHAAKRAKLGALEIEAFSRTKRDKAVGWKNPQVLMKYKEARTAITDLPTILDVNDYDVVNDPSWP